MSEFRVFLLQYWFPNKDERTQSTLIFTHSWWENNWIHAFLKVIRAMGNVIDFVQDLNSSRSVPFPTTLTINTTGTSLCVYVCVNVYLYTVQQ